MPAADTLFLKLRLNVAYPSPVSAEARTHELPPHQDCSITRSGTPTPARPLPATR